MEMFTVNTHIFILGNLYIVPLTTLEFVAADVTISSSPETVAPGM